MNMGIREIFIAASLILVASFSGGTLLVRSAFVETSAEVCDLVDRNYYKKGGELDAWLRYCRIHAAGLPWYLGKTELIRHINQVLGTLGVSHLFLYDPAENRQLWENEALDTGARARLIDGAFVIHQVLPDSPAAVAGLRPGDVVRGINGYTLTSPSDVQSNAGLFSLQRGDETLEVSVAATSLFEDQRPVLTDLGGGRAVLRIASFLPQYFDRDEWLLLAGRLARYRHVVVDLRGNAGGSFPAMVRAASSFYCEPRFLGAMVQSESEAKAESARLEDDLKGESQLEKLAVASRVELWTFPGYGCFDGAATVLVDAGTSSVAEIFAENFFTRPKSRVWGSPTAGQVVLARWFPVARLGSPEYSLSVPIAGFMTSSGTELEAEGLYPQKLLYYQLADAVRGKDTWLLEAEREP